jgi:hypothetical protein
MSTQKLSNIPIAVFRNFLKTAGCNLIRTEGGHEVWAKKELTRPIILQTHIEPVPEFIIKNALRNLGLNRNDFFTLLSGSSASTFN